MDNQPLSSNDQAHLLIFIILFIPSVFFLVGVIPAVFLGLGIYLMKKNQSFSSIQTAVKYFKGYTALILIGCAIAAIYQSYSYISHKDQILNNIKILPSLEMEPDTGYDISHPYDFHPYDFHLGRNLTFYTLDRESSLNHISQAAKNVLIWEAMKLGPEPTSELEIDLQKMSPSDLSLKYSSDLASNIISSRLNASRWAYSEAYELARLKSEIIFYSTISLIALAYIFAINYLFLTPLRRHKEWVEVNGIFSTKPKVSSNSEIKTDRNIIKSEKYKSYSVADELIKWAKLKEDGHITDEQFQEFKDNLLK